MTANVEPRRRLRLLLLLPVVAIALGFLLGPGVSAAQAQTDNCAIEQFIGADGTTVDLTAYSACVAAANAANAANGTEAAALPRTGADVGQYVGLGSGLIALGAAFVWSSRRTRRRVDA